jgi:hypothetical protein
VKITRSELFFSLGEKISRAEKLDAASCSVEAEKILPEMEPPRYRK